MLVRSMIYGSTFQVLPSGLGSLGHNLRMWSVYGTEGTGAATNSPGARSAAFSWTDQSGVLWLFGGEGLDLATGNYVAFSDLWKFQPSTGLWTWVGGSSTEYTAGTDGTIGVASATNLPGARYSGASWIDSAGNLWLFGGVGP